MIFILEAVNYYEDTWEITFYFLVALALLLGLLWTYYQVIIKGDKNKEKLKENVIYNHPDDVIENFDIYPKKKESVEIKNNYKIKDYSDNINLEENIETNLNSEITKESSVVETPINSIKEDSLNINNEEKITINKSTTKANKTKSSSNNKNTNNKSSNKNNYKNNKNNNSKKNYNKNQSSK